MPNYEKNEKGYVRVAAAFEIGGWHDDDLVAACVLQQLLGGGDSFSAGGPGKGMYSRLYREVLNRHSWCDAAEAFLALHDDTGLLGISGAAEPRRAGELVGVFLEQLARREVPVDADGRCRRLKLSHAGESRLVLFEDLARQVATYGHREDMAKASAHTRSRPKTSAHRPADALKPPPIAAHVSDLGLRRTPADGAGRREGRVRARARARAHRHPFWVASRRGSVRTRRFPLASRAAAAFGALGTARCTRRPLGGRTTRTSARRRARSARSGWRGS